MRYAIIALTTIIAVAASCAGYEAGKYLTTEQRQKVAISRQCGLINPETLAFEWPMPIGMTMTDFLDAPKPQRKPK